MTDTPPKKVFTRETLEEIEKRLSVFVKKITAPAPVILEPGWVHDITDDTPRFVGRHHYLTARLVACLIKDKAVRREVDRARSFKEAISASGEDPYHLEYRCRAALQKQLIKQLVGARRGTLEETVGYIGVRDPFALAHLFWVWVEPVLENPRSEFVREFWKNFKLIPQQRRYTEEFELAMVECMRQTLRNEETKPLLSIASIYYRLSGASRPRSGDPPVKQRIVEETKRLLSWVRTRYQETGKYEDLLTQTSRMFDTLPVLDPYVENKNGT